jgi:ABC-type hemin transport system substrate-binding protein
VGSLQNYEYSLPPVKKAKTIALKASKKKVRVSSEEDIDNEEDAMATLAKNFGRLMKSEKFKKKFTERLKMAPRESKPKEGPKRFHMF